MHGSCNENSQEIPYLIVCNIDVFGYVLFNVPNAYFDKSGFGSHLFREMDASLHNRLPGQFANITCNNPNREKNRQQTDCVTAILLDSVGNSAILQSAILSEKSSALGLYDRISLRATKCHNNVRTLRRKNAFTAQKRLTNWNL